MIALELSDNIMNMDTILKTTFQDIVNFLLIKKQQKDLEYYMTAKPAIENKKTVK